MQGDEERTAGEGPLGSRPEKSRPQQAGAAATTRFGMEEGDNTDVAATGGPTADDEASQRAS